MDKIVPISSLVNDPIDFKIGEKTFKVIKISQAQIYKYVEVDIISRHKKRIEDFASLFSGKEKIDYVSCESAKIPYGDSLLSEIATLLTSNNLYSMSVIIYLALRKNNKIEFSEVQDLFLTEDQTELSLVAKYAMGIKEEVKEVKEGASEENPLSPVTEQKEKTE